MVLYFHKWLLRTCLRFVVWGMVACCAWPLQAQDREQNGQSQNIPIQREQTQTEQVQNESPSSLAPSLDPILDAPLQPTIEPEIEAAPQPDLPVTPIAPAAPTAPAVEPPTAPALELETTPPPVPPISRPEPIPAPVLAPEPEDASLLEPIAVPNFENSPAITPPLLSSPAFNRADGDNREDGEEIPSPSEAVDLPLGEAARPSLLPDLPFATPASTPIPTPAVNSNLPQDLSPYGMFMQADIIVKTVMVGLLAASVLTWVIWLAKSIEITMAKHRARRAVKTLISSRSLAEAIEKVQSRKGVSAHLIMAAAREVRLSLGAVDGAGSEGMKERVASQMVRIEVRSGRVISRGLGILASIGSVAPFVGLFGTVWGIINAFIGISHAQTTNLAVVAPGIAEALLATAMGLFAAIPAVVIYNVFVRSITVYRQMLTDISSAIERLISRDLDFRMAHKKAGQPLLETVGG